MEALSTTFGVDEVAFATPAGGMFLWASFRSINDATAWLHRCLEHDVCFVPGSAFGPDSGLGHFARLSFATCPTSQLSEATQRLRAAVF